MTFPTLPLLLPLLLAQTAAAAAAPPAAPIPIRAFVGDELLAPPKLSPDGKRLVLATRTLFKDREVRGLAVLALESATTEALMPFPPEQVPMNFTWVSNTRIVAARGFRAGSRGPVLARGEVLAVNRDGSQARYLFGLASGKSQGYGYVASVPAQYDGHVSLAEVMWHHDSTYLHDMDTATGYRTTITQVPQAHATFLLQHDGQPRFAYGHDEGGKFQLWRRGDGARDWQRVPDSRVGSLLQPIAFSADDSEFFALHSAAGGPEVLVAEHLARGARRVAAADPAGDIDTLMQVSRRDAPFAALSSVGIPRVHYLKPDGDRDVQLHRELSRHFKDAVVEFINASEDGGKVLFSVRSDRDPGSYYLYDRATNKANLLLARMLGIVPEQMAERRPIAFQGRDGTTLHGFLTMPAHAAGAKLPLVLIPHDGPNGFRDRWYFDADAQFLASRGYATLQVNHRGSGGMGPAFERAAFGQWGGKVLDDLADGVRWAAGNADIDGNRMCVFGTGFGALPALTLAAREPKLFKCAIGYAGVYDVGLYAGEGFMSEIGSGENVERFVTDKRAEMKALSATTQAASIEAAVLLIHGGEDRIAPDSHATRMRAALRKAGREPEWFHVDDEGHGFHKLDNQVEVYRRLEAFLAKHLAR
ncbi:dipeptidyl aminopeptidase/acylaminoacyl peptidase [Pseudoduganella flava]|nr:prolyl oligopeptidase family serine peptidase [Pseudoduganella flava]TWI42859.1 dipeptidyl aminopeptidase/acylaminoacyl peptidase [Pseudoduganella flava]